MIGRKNRKRVSTAETAQQYIYYDQSALDLKIKKCIQVVVTNFRQLKLMIIIDTLSQDEIKSKIRENLESFPEFIDIGRINIGNFFMSQKEGKTVQISDDDDFTSLLEDGVTLLCKVITNCVWLDVKVNMSSSITMLSMKFEIKIEKSFTIKKMKLCLLKRILSEWSSSTYNHKLFYLIKSTRLQILSSSNNIKLIKFLDQIKYEEDLDSLLVGKLIDFNTTAIVHVELISIEQLLFEYLQRVVAETSLIEKLKRSILQFTTISFPEFIFKRKYQIEFISLKKSIYRYLKYGNEEAALQETDENKNNFICYQFNDLEDESQDMTNEYLISTLSEDTGGIEPDPHELRIKPRMSESREEIHFFCQKECKNDDSEFILIIMPSDYQSTNSSYSFNTKLINEVKVEKKKEKKTSHNSFFNSNYFSPNVSISKDQLLNSADDAASARETESTNSSVTLPVLLNSILYKNLHWPKLISKDCFYCLNTSSVIDIYTSEVRKMMVTLEDQTMEVKQFYYQPSEEPLTIRNARIITVISSIVIAYVLLVVILLFLEM